MLNERMQNGKVLIEKGKQVVAASTFQTVGAHPVRCAVFLRILSNC